jgi:hypothetical protein
MDQPQRRRGTEEYADRRTGGDIERIAAPVWIAVALPGNLYVSVVKAEAFE